MGRSLPRLAILVPPCRPPLSPLRIAVTGKAMAPLEAFARAIAAVRAGGIDAVGAGPGGQLKIVAERVDDTPSAAGRPAAGRRLPAAKGGAYRGIAIGCWITVPDRSSMGFDSPLERTPPCSRTYRPP